MSNIDPLLEALTVKTDWYVVLRPFQGDGDERYVRGEVVNARTWMHRRRLVDLRYIAPLPHGAPFPEEDADGRRVVVLDEAAAAEIHPQRRPAEPAVEPAPEPAVEPEAVVVGTGADVVADPAAPSRPVPVRKPKTSKPRKASQQ